MRLGVVRVPMLSDCHDTNVPNVFRALTWCVVPGTQKNDVGLVIGFPSTYIAP
jgi:hypothetical protein